MTPGNTAQPDAARDRVHADSAASSADDPVGGGRVSDVAVDGERVRVLGRFYRAGGSDHALALPTVGRDQARADACEPPVMMATFRPVRLMAFRPARSWAG